MGEERAKDDQRKARLAAALRANLKRRKAPPPDTEKPNTGEGADNA